MEIINIPFEQIYTIEVYGQPIQITLYKTTENGQVKFGITAPRQVKVNREEIYSKQKMQSLDKQYVTES